MPLIMWFFSAAFIAGIARIMLAAIGVGIFTYIGTEFLIVWFQDYIVALEGEDARVNAVFDRIGFYTWINWIIAAWTTRLLITSLKSFRLK